MTDYENRLKEIPAILEALLFISPEPILISQLASALGIANEEVENGIRQLDSELATRGLRLQRHEGRIQLTTSPPMAESIERFLGLEATSRLSRAALETLAIVAYQQPVTRPTIEEIRGVSSEGVMKSLIGKGLIRETGRAMGPGRPILYGTTSEFLGYFGLKSLDELPALSLSEIDEGNGHNGTLKG